MRAALVILDGWGLDEHERRNAVASAETPVFDEIWDRGASAALTPTGRTVGLPDGQMGNSEVGHLTIGAGRPVPQEYLRIEEAIAEGRLGENDAIAGAFDHAEDHDGRVHFMGLVSDGGVHSDHRHLHALIGLAAERGVPALTHAFTDGRDTPPKSARGYLSALADVIDEHGTGHVATVVGRYHAMDRDENWERTHRAYRAIVERETDWTAPDPRAAVQASYERGDSDEFVEPTLVDPPERPTRDPTEDGGPPVGESSHEPAPPTVEDPALRAGDAVIWFNFRADRARQLVRMLADIRPDSWPMDTDPPDVPVVTMTRYDRTFDLPVAFPPAKPTTTLGQAIAEAGLTQLRIAESEKYPHVTYFLNGGREVEYEGEIRHIVPSPDVPTYDRQPEMSAEGVTDVAIETIRERDPDVLVLNYANPDMVGHTGDFDAAVTAVEAVDTQLGRLLETLREAGAHAIVTADHGNADDMGTAADPHTAHTHAPVPVVYLTPDGDDGGRRIRGGGTLADLAPTLLELATVAVPHEMTGASLLE